jgi:AraC-like DNA-binding protein
MFIYAFFYVTFRRKLTLNLIQKLIFDFFLILLMRMKLSIKYDITIACKKILQEQLDKLHIPYVINSISEVTIKEPLSSGQQQELSAALREYGIEILTNQKMALVQKIKDTIVEMVHSENGLPSVTMSIYLSEKLNHSYSYLSNLFSEASYTSIENFIIIQKIERAKQLLLENELTLTEISYQLNYSSVAHLSHQFKKTTGITPSAFQRIIKKRAINNLS